MSSETKGQAVTHPSLEALREVEREMERCDVGSNKNDFGDLHGTFPILSWASRIKAAREALEAWFEEHKARVVPPTPPSFEP